MGSYSYIPKAIFYLLKGDYTKFQVFGKYIQARACFRPQADVELEERHTVQQRRAFKMLAMFERRRVLFSEPECIGTYLDPPM